MSINNLTTPNTSRDQHERHDSGETKIFGLWIYLMSDCILFGCLFATYAVLKSGTAGGPSGKEIFDLRTVLLETFLLLCSSMLYSMAFIATKTGRASKVNGLLLPTFVFGLGFLAIEIHEFYNLISEGFGPDRSAFLSSFFALTATHGLHVLFGLAWIIIVMIRLVQRGLTEANQTDLICLGLFWHFLDLIWIFLFTLVYLMGAS